mmetsp:Transcript_45812/g.76318  ORF Transcript_45812/g.76318 Transcript_45812/m.76318 type:complete len:485 (+) Transcript_45812:264-1718(+)
MGSTSTTSSNSHVRLFFLGTLAVATVFTLRLRTIGSFETHPIGSAVGNRLSTPSVYQEASRGLGYRGRLSSLQNSRRYMRHIRQPKSSGTPSWEDLGEMANVKEILRDFTVRQYPVAPTTVAGRVVEESIASSPSRASKNQPVILYRDTNAWCPFCERVWLALLEKDIKFEQYLIDLFDKPEWYKELVPTAQTPAALINGKMVWESSNILDEIEEAFPEPSLKPTNDQEEELALRVKTLTEDELGVKGYGYMRSNASNEADAKTEFQAVLSKLEAELAVFEGPFFLPHFSNIDILVTPQLERFSANLGVFKGFSIKGNPEYPNLNAWFKAMDDKPSYRAVKSDDRTLNQIMSKVFRLAATTTPSEQPVVNDANHPRREAAAKLVGNYKSVAADIAKNSGVEKSEKSRAAIDTHLKRVVTALLTSDAGTPSKSASEAAVGAASLAFLRNRVSSPRDMSAGAAEEFRRAVDSVLLATYDGGKAQED